MIHHSERMMHMPSKSALLCLVAKRDHVSQTVCRLKRCTSRGLRTEEVHSVLVAQLLQYCTRGIQSVYLLGSPLV